MKRMLFGIALTVCGVIGTLILIFSVIPISQSLGSINSNSSIFVYLDWYGLTPLFGGFVVMGGVGIIICVIDAYFNKSTKQA